IGVAGSLLLGVAAGGAWAEILWALANRSAKGPFGIAYVHPDPLFGLLLLALPSTGFLLAERRLLGIVAAGRPAKAVVAGTADQQRGDRACVDPAVIIPTLRCTDLTRSVDFYTRILDFRLGD